MQLSGHFSLRELTASQTALRKGIDNKPTPEHVENLTELAVQVLEPTRRHFGKPISISSGYRSEELCVAINSSKTSQHTKGQAVDFEIAGVSNLELALWIQNNTDFDQLILEYWKEDEGANSGWVHCSFNQDSNRKQVLTFDGKNYINGLPEAKWSGGKLTN